MTDSGSTNSYEIKSSSFNTISAVEGSIIYDKSNSCDN
jgi:hypothetical protein